MGGDSVEIGQIGSTQLTRNAPAVVDESRSTALKSREVGESTVSPENVSPHKDLRCRGCAGIG
jgi:hypothetical protein